MLLTVLFVKAGQFGLRRIVRQGKINQAVRVEYKLMETTLQQTREASISSGRNITQAQMIMNLAGYNTREHACLQCKKKLNN